MMLLNNRGETPEGDTMKKYTISFGEKKLATGIKAESAIAALDCYCSAHPDDDTGFQRGGLSCDAETQGGEFASVRTDAGRIAAEVDE